MPSPISFPIPRTETLLTSTSSQRTPCSSSLPCYTPSIATLPYNTPSFATSPCNNPGIATSFVAPKVSSLSIATPSVVSGTIIDNTVANSLTDIVQLMIVDDMIEDLNVLIANTNSMVDALSCSPPLYSSVDFNSNNVPFGVNSNRCGPSSSLLGQSYNTLLPNSIAVSEIDSIISSTGPNLRSNLREINTLGSNLYDYSEVSSFGPSSSVGSNCRSNFNFQEVLTPCVPNLYGSGTIQKVSSPFVPKLSVTEFNTLLSSPFGSNSFGNFQNAVNSNTICGCGSIPEGNPFTPNLSFTEYSPLSSLPLGSNSLGSFQEVFNPGSCIQQQVPNLCQFPQVNHYPSSQSDLNPCGNLQELNYPRIPNCGFAQDNLASNVYGSNQDSFILASVNSNTNQLTPSSSVSTEVNTETVVSVNSNPYDNIQDGTSISTNTQVATEVDISTPAINVVEDIISLSLPSVSPSYSNVVNNIPVSPNVYETNSFSPIVLELIIPSYIPAQLACNVLPHEY